METLNTIFMIQPTLHSPTHDLQRQDGHNRIQPCKRCSTIPEGRCWLAPCITKSTIACVCATEAVGTSVSPWSPCAQQWRPLITSHQCGHWAARALLLSGHAATADCHNGGLDRAPNDPSVFTIMEKVPTRALTWLKGPTSA